MLYRIVFAAFAGLLFHIALASCQRQNAPNRQEASMSVDTALQPEDWRYLESRPMHLQAMKDYLNQQSPPDERSITIARDHVWLLRHFDTDTLDDCPIGSLDWQQRSLRLIAKEKQWTYLPAPNAAATIGMASIKTLWEQLTEIDRKVERHGEVAYAHREYSNDKVGAAVICMRSQDSFRIRAHGCLVIAYELANGTLKTSQEKYMLESASTKWHFDVKIVTRWDYGDDTNMYFIVQGIKKLNYNQLPSLGIWQGMTLIKVVLPMQDKDKPQALGKREENHHFNLSAAHAQVVEW